MSKQTKEPNPIDVHVGGRVRLKRTMMGMSQEKLGETIGITFQQIQKYEKGSNRIGASRLQQISAALNTPISFFFDEAPNSNTGSADGMGEADNSNFVVDFLSTNEGLQLNRGFLKIKDPQVRKKIIDLVRSLADED